MHTPTALPPVPPAMAGAIDDQALRQAIGCANAARTGDLTAAEFSFLMLVMAPLLEELRAWRRQAALPQAAPAPLPAGGNVVSLDAVRP